MTHHGKIWLCALLFWFGVFATDKGAQVFCGFAAVMTTFAALSYQDTGSQRK